MPCQRKLRVYIAGPIAKGDLESNIQQSDVAFKELAQLGFAPFNPMWSCFAGSAKRNMDMNGRRYGVVEGTATSGSSIGLSHKDWVDLDLAWVEVADAVLRLPGESVGADRETGHARKKEIPVFHAVDDLVRFFSNDPRYSP